MGGRTLAFTVAGVLTLGSPLASQQTQQATPTFRSTADLVRLHVVVRDEQGRPVRGLTKGDFALLDSKQPRAIEIFEEVGRPDEPRLKSIVPTEFPLDVADNRVARASHLVVIVFDDMVIRPYLQKSKELAKAAVTRLGADALIGLLMTSGTDGVETTADHAAILRAIDRVGTPASKAPKIPERFGSQTSHATLAESPMGNRMDTTAKSCHLDMLEQAARMVTGPEATRRIFVYITPFCGRELIDEEEATPYERIGLDYEALLDALRRADVAVYALDPRGEMGFRLDQFPSMDITGASAPTHKPTIRSYSPVIASQKGLRELTAATGGFAVTNSTAFEAGLNQIEDDLSHYYVLGFYANDPKPNGYHPVEVKVNRPGLTGRFRPGYFSGPPPVREDKDPMVRLAAGAIPTPDLPLRLFAVSEPRGRNSRVNLMLEVGWTGLEKPNAAGKVDEFLDGMVLVSKVMSGKVERKWAVKRPVAVPVPASSPGFAAYQVLTQVDLPPGSYQFRVSAKSQTGRTGSVYLAVEVPKSAPVALGEILVGALDRVAPTLAPSPASVAQLPFPITLDRVFTRNEHLRLFAKVFRSHGTAPLAAEVEFEDAAGQIVKTLDAPLAKSDQAIDTTVELNGLAPGAYLARLVINASAASASREVSIVVK